MAYADLDALNLVFGSTNVEQWADLDNDADETKIANRIAWALTLAEATVNDALREGPYTIPFTSVPTVIEDITCRLAGMYLYDGRRMHEEDDGTARYNINYHRKYARETMQEIRTGGRKLDADRTDNIPVIPDFDDDD